MKAMRFDHKYEVSRQEKAEKIRRILQDFSSTDLGELKCLDLGCATGTITNILKSSFHTIFGVEVDEKLIREAEKLSTKESIFVVADGGSTPFQSQSFDVIICAQVYEHTKNPQALSDEIWRLLKPGGICFFSGPNRWSLIEEHYYLPFLSWLPHTLANLYLRLLKRGSEYDVHPYFYWQLRTLFKYFGIHEYTIPLIRQPERFGLTTQANRLKLIRHLPTWLLKLVILWLPNYNWVLVKQP